MQLWYSGNVAASFHYGCERDRKTLAPTKISCIESLNGFEVKRGDRNFRIRLFVGLSGCFLIFTGLAILIFCLLLVDIRIRLAPKVVPSSYQDVVKGWQSPTQNETWIEHLDAATSGHVIPIPCHSHNDYWHRVPLFEALAAGCTGIEADLWLPTSVPNNSKLLVGHNRRELRAERSLENLYINPLSTILDLKNEGRRPKSKRLGVYDVDPNATLVLLLDFKEEAAEIWPLVQISLKPLREKRYLRHWNGAEIVPGPVTVVVSGEAAFNLITANATHRDIFFDAPLDKLQL